ncbi:MAG: hypothetical protein ACXW5U_01715 [Thermoanaerobaculia bacterium]
MERAALAEQLSIAVRNGKAAEARVSELEKKFVASRDELAPAEEALRKGKVERDALQAKADKLTADLATAHNHLDKEKERRAELNKHVLVRLDSYLHH